MKAKLRNKSGLTLMEMLVSILILTMLVVGMGTGMNTALEVYKKSNFESKSATLADTVNTAMSDVLHYALDVNPEAENGPTFTNVDNNLLKVCFAIKKLDADEDDTNEDSMGILCLKNATGKEVLLLSRGTYGSLAIKNLKVVFCQDEEENVERIGGKGQLSTAHGSFFYITYEIVDTTDATLVRQVENIVRPISYL